MKILVALINQYDDPDINKAKMAVNWFFEKTEQGAWVKRHMRGMDWCIEPDGGMEPHYIVEVTADMADRDCTFYHLKWPDPHGAVK